MSGNRRTGLLRTAALLVVLGAVLILAISRGGSDHPSHRGTPPFPRLQAQPPGQLLPRFFSVDSPWNRELPPDAPLDPQSPQLSAAVAAMARNPGSALSVRSYSVPIYEAGPHQPVVQVLPDVPNPPLRRAFEQVPLPADAHPAAGTDAHLALYQPSTDTMWEFWKLRQVDGTWHAGYGGRIVRVSQNPGYFQLVRGSDRRVVEEPYWGATATGLPLVAGLITPEELRQGQINHALALGLPMIRAGVRAAPAQRSDGRFYGPDSVPEGARFRLDPSLNLDALGLPRPTLIIARAAQRYGMIVRDGAGNVAMYAQDPANLPSNPYPALLGKLRPYQVLKSFPWDHLELLEMKLRAATR